MNLKTLVKTLRQEVNRLRELLSHYSSIAYEEKSDAKIVAEIESLIEKQDFSVLSEEDGSIKSIIGYDYHVFEITIGKYHVILEEQYMVVNRRAIRGFPIIMTLYEECMNEYLLQHEKGRKEEEVD